MINGVRFGEIVVIKGGSYKEQEEAAKKLSDSLTGTNKWHTPTPGEQEEKLPVRQHQISKRTPTLEYLVSGQGKMEGSTHSESMRFVITGKTDTEWFENRQKTLKASINIVPQDHHADYDKLNMTLARELYQRRTDEIDLGTQKTTSTAVERLDRIS
jgi:hypothetical protein